MKQAVLSSNKVSKNIIVNRSLIDRQYNFRIAFHFFVSNKFAIIGE